MIWSRCPELNRRPTLYESAALPTELQRQSVIIGYYSIPTRENKRSPLCCTESQKLLSYCKFTRTYGLVVKWLSRLPVTEEITGSNPAEPAIKIIKKYTVYRYIFLICH
jgi:hypothetical protein